jgi:hypothetical protein
MTWGDLGDFKHRETFKTATRPLTNRRNREAYIPSLLAFKFLLLTPDFTQRR